MSLRLAAVGYAGAFEPIAATQPRIAGPNRVDYTHRGVSEWYANGPLGLEQASAMPGPTEQADRSGPPTGPATSCDCFS